MSQTSLRESLVGARRPRVELHPPFAYTLGPEACELATRARLVPDPWQADAIDLMLACREDGKWACYEYGEIVARQNGKGSILEIRVLAGFLLLGEQLIMWSAHEYKTSMEAFRRMRTLVRRLGRQVNPNNENLWDIDGVLVKIVNTNGEEGFERADTEARIKFVARSKGSGRGFSGDLVIIDESFAFTLEQQDALMPAMAARPNAQIIYTSSPPLNGVSGEVMFNLKRRADAGGDDSLGWRDWGVAGDLDHLDQIDLDDRALWAASNPALGMRLTEETILRERRSMGDMGFARERLCVWPQLSQGNIVIDSAAWARMADADSRRSGAVSVAVDLSPLRDYAAVCVYGAREDEFGHVQLADYRPGTKWLVPRLVELRNTLGPVAFAMGRGTFAFLEVELSKAGFTRPDDMENPETGDLAVTGAVEMAAATGQLLEAVREESFRYVPARPLDVAVAGAKTRATGDTIAWTPKGAEVDTSPLVAMSLARWSYVTRQHLLDGNAYNVLESVF